MSTKKGKFLQIPIVSHKSEKPFLVFEEMSSGKLYPTIHTFKSEKKLEKNSGKKASSSNNNKKYVEIPIVAHDSEKPSMVIEEISFGKNASNFPTSVTNYKYGGKSKKIEENKKSSVIVHESEKPSLCFEEISSGKLFSNIATSVTNYKENKNKSENKLKSKNNNKKEKKINIIIHESEKPSMVFEEVNGGNKYKAYQTSVTEYKEDKKKKKLNNEEKKIRNEEKKNKCEKTKIIVHESEKPSIVFEQNNAGKLYSNVKTSETDFGKIKKLKKIYDFKEILIVSHKSEKPSVVFEEANTGIVIDFHHMI